MTHAANLGLEGARPLSTGWSSADDLAVALTVLAATPREIGQGRLVAVVPAPGDQDVAPALDSLRAQHRPPDLVVVAAAGGACDPLAAAVVLETRCASAGKAGTVNEALAHILPTLEDTDAILVMDAGSALAPTFVDAALRRLGTTRRTGGQDRVVAGIAGTVRGGRGGGVLGTLQRNEYARRADAVPGAAAVFSVKALREVVAARAAGRPTDEAQVYDTEVLVADDELTHALAHLGYTMGSPAGCVTEIGVVAGWRELWNQRLRRQRGAVETLARYGWNGLTLRYWGRQVLAHFAVLVTVLYLVGLVWTVVTTGTMRASSIWLAAVGAVAVERIVTVRARGPRQMALAGVVVIELGLALVLQAALATALWEAATGTVRGRR